MNPVNGSRLSDTSVKLWWAILRGSPLLSPCAWSKWSKKKISVCISRDLKHRFLIKPNNNEVDKELRNAEAMEKIKSIFGEQLEPDTSWQRHLGVRRRLPGAVSPPRHCSRVISKHPKSLCWSSGWYPHPCVFISSVRKQHPPRWCSQTN